MSCVSGCRFVSQKPKCLSKILLINTIDAHIFDWPSTAKLKELPRRDSFRNLDTHHVVVSGVSQCKRNINKLSDYVEEISIANVRKTLLSDNNFTFQIIMKWHNASRGELFVLKCILCAGNLIMWFSLL